MIVMILERVPPRLRGELSRWMIEPRAGVFVGTMSGMVRDKLWEKVVHLSEDGSAILIHSARREQGFAVRVHGDPSRELIEMEGLHLVRCPRSG